MYHCKQDGHLCPSLFRLYIQCLPIGDAVPSSIIRIIPSFLDLTVHCPSCCFRTIRFMCSYIYCFEPQLMTTYATSAYRPRFGVSSAIPYLGVRHNERFQFTCVNHTRRQVNINHTAPTFCRVNTLGYSAFPPPGCRRVLHHILHWSPVRP